VEATISTLRAVWSGATGGVAGFLQPDPPPPVIVGGFGPKMAELAGRLGDGANLPAGPSLPGLIDIARAAPARRGRDPDRFLITASGSPADERLAAIGVQRVITMVRPPYAVGVRRVAAAAFGV
jgi:alkanesulfonate monooxygenase SsuD/methylene tetrahydromethanopterin reductase-like flavin-dependent oxidoreductase (luciferase family)